LPRGPCHEDHATGSFHRVSCYWNFVKNVTGNLSQDLHGTALQGPRLGDLVTDTLSRGLCHRVLGIGIRIRSQLQALHFAAEARQRSLKEHLLGVEAERERVRTDSQSKLGTTSREARALQARLRTSRHAHKQSRENALAAERLKRDAFAGLQHVCTTLGVPPPDADTPVAEVVHAVESVLDALIEEKDKAAQRTADASQSLRDDELKARSPELEAALDQFEMPKALIAHRLTGKPKDDPAALANDSNDAAVPSRTDVKRDAQKSVRAEQRRQARLVGVPEK